MKVTKYFISSNRNYESLKLIINEAENERNIFLAENENTIGEIEREDIQIVSTSSGRIQAIITLTYFPKSL